MIDFTPINTILQNALSLNEDKVWIWSVDEKEVKDEIIKMNTNDQLYELGIDSKGKSLGEYSPITIIYKRSRGERFDHVTLFDEGDFYESFTVKVNNKGFEIDADDVKSSDTALFDVYGEDVLGLTDENMKYLREIVLERYKKYLYERIF